MEAGDHGVWECVLSEERSYQALRQAVDLQARIHFSIIPDTLGLKYDLKARILFSIKPDTLGLKFDLKARIYFSKKNKTDTLGCKV